MTNKKKSMKKVKRDELRPEYKRSDLGRGVRGKYYKLYQSGTNLVLLSPDVAEVFRDAEAVNEALRTLIKAVHQSVSSTKHATDAQKHTVELHKEQAKHPRKRKGEPKQLKE